MTITDADRKRLNKIAKDLRYACTFADLKWLVQFAEKLLKECDGQRPTTKGQRLKR
jgi:hypothetical protein